MHENQRYHMWLLVPKYYSLIKLKKIYKDYNIEQVGD